MKTKKMPPLNQLLQSLKYDPQTGLFYRKFVNKRKKTIKWKQTGHVDANGYVIIKYKNLAYYAHRLAYYIHTKIDPNFYDIDHVNNITTDNRINNLRLSTTSQNCYNSKAKSTNKTGYKGVCKGNSGYTAQIYVNGKKYHLGTYKNAFYAFVQYCKAAKKYHNEFKKYI